MDINQNKILDNNDNNNNNNNAENVNENKSKISSENSSTSVPTDLTITLSDCDYDETSGNISVPIEEDCKELPPPVKKERNIKSQGNFPAHHGLKLELKEKNKSLPYLRSKENIQYGDGNVLNNLKERLREISKKYQEYESDNNKVAENSDEPPYVNDHAKSFKKADSSINKMQDENKDLKKKINQMNLESHKKQMKHLSINEYLEQELYKTEAENKNLSYSLEKKEKLINFLEAKFKQIFKMHDVIKKSSQQAQRDMLETKEKNRTDYETKLSNEIYRLRSSTSKELEKFSKNATEGFKDEILILKESRDLIEKSRNELSEKLRETEHKHQELLLKMKQMQFADLNRLSQLESDLKLKNYELEKTSHFHQHLEEKYKLTNYDKNNLARKCEKIKEENIIIKAKWERQLYSLTMELQEKSSRLEEYEKLESEFDKIISKAALLPPERVTADIFSEFGIRVPANAKRHLLKSMQLSRKILELESELSVLKSELFAERDTKEILRQELIEAKKALVYKKAPASCLIETIMQRDITISKFEKTIKEQNLEILSLKKLDCKLKEELENASKHNTEVDRIKETILKQLVKERNIEESEKKEKEVEFEMLEIEGKLEYYLSKKENFQKRIKPKVITHKDSSPFTFTKIPYAKFLESMVKEEERQKRKLSKRAKSSDK